MPRKPGPPPTPEAPAPLAWTLGVGFALARHALDHHPGAWEVGQMTANTAAQAFWRQTISALTNGAFVEIVVKEVEWQGVVQQFDVPTAG